MAEYFKKVMVSERLPKKEGWHVTDNGDRYFKKDWIYDFDIIDRGVGWWLEESEGHVLTDEELKETKRTEAIKFLETIRSYEHENSELIAFDERSSEELYDLYLTTKEDGK